MDLTPPSVSWSLLHSHRQRRLIDVLEKIIDVVVSNPKVATYNSHVLRTDYRWRMKIFASLVASSSLSAKSCARPRFVSFLSLSVNFSFALRCSTPSSIPPHLTCTMRGRSLSLSDSCSTRIKDEKEEVRVKRCCCWKGGGTTIERMMHLEEMRGGGPQRGRWDWESPLSCSINCPCIIRFC